MATIKFANFRHGFGEHLGFDAVVDGARPVRRDVLLELTQPRETYRGFLLAPPTAYVAIPVASLQVARSVIDAITHSPSVLCSVFRSGEAITVRLCWPDAPAVDWSIRPEAAVL